jgi:hypothetical protein
MELLFIDGPLVGTEIILDGKKPVLFGCNIATAYDQAFEVISHA